jgi:RNA polymerase sigma factor (sigma-70 family)
MTDAFTAQLEAAIAAGAGAGHVVVLCLSRLRSLASRMLREHPVLRRRHDTDDLLQNAALRLQRALNSVEIESPAHAMALAVTQLKRELIDMVRSMAVVEERFPDAMSRRNGIARDEALHSWESFHAAVDGLPADQREAVHFLWYLGLEQEDAAKLLGITARTLRRRWQDAKTNLRAQLDADDFRSGR